MNIAVPSVDLWLLVRMERILQGDLDPAIDLYSKASIKDKDREKAVASVKVCYFVTVVVFCFGLTSLF